MDSHLLSDIDNQILYLQQALSAANNMKSKCLLLETEKREALEKCARLDKEVQRLKNAKCSNCNVLQRKLGEERKKRETFHRTEKERFMKSIEKALESMDDVNTNQMTNAHQLFTQIVVDGLASPSQNTERSFHLINDSDKNVHEATTVLANETMVVAESEETPECPVIAAVVIPETEMPVSSWRDVQRAEEAHQCSRSREFSSVNVSKENKIGEETGIVHTSKKFKKMSPTLNKNEFNRHLSYKSASGSGKNDVEKTLVLEKSSRSPSVLSEIIDEINASSTRMNKIKGQEEKGAKWKMKPSVLLESNPLATSGRKMKQMTLNVAQPEKKHDISLSQTFNGGVLNFARKHSEEDRDVILPSPENLKRRNFQRPPQQQTNETLEDPDVTVFQPAVTSTCLPSLAKLDNSFDRLPEPDKSPPYKYRRDTVRKKADRLKLPGQECDECIKYYEAAGLDKTQDIRNRMNMCSRHRDKYRIRANTPPGFWNPVMPNTPEES